MSRGAALVLLGLALGRPAAAQLLPLTVPKGKLRVDPFGRFESWDRRWRGGTREDAATDFIRSPLDPSFVPDLGPAEARLGRITGLSDASLSLGRSTAAQLVNRGTLGMGGALGVSRWLTLFVTVPLVRVKVRSRFDLDTLGATAGLNAAHPVFGNPAAAAAFFGEMATALAGLESRIASGAFDQDPALKSLAQATAARGRMLEAELQALLTQAETASPFAPRAESDVGLAVIQAIRDLQTTLGGLGVSGFARLPPLPTGPLTAAQFADYVTNPAGPIAARPFGEAPEIQYVGDVELGAAISLVDRFPKEAFGTGLRAALEATVRLPTAQLDQPDRFFDVGTGDRQPDLAVTLVTDLAAGRLGVRLTGGFDLQLAGGLDRRVTPPDRPLAPASALAAVRRDPGDVWRVSARPFLRLAPYLSVFGAVEYWRRGTDAFRYAAGQAPIEGVDIAVLASGSEADALLLSGGVSFSHSGVGRGGPGGLPLDANLRYQRIARSKTGSLPDVHDVRLDFRFYTAVWR